MTCAVARPGRPLHDRSMTVDPPDEHVREIALVDRAAAGDSDAITEVVRILREPEVSQRLLGLGMEVLPSTPEGLRTRMVDDMGRYESIIRAAGIEAQ